MTVPSVLAKTLPPSVMGFGWTETGANILNEIRCFPHLGNRDGMKCEMFRCLCYIYRDWHEGKGTHFRIGKSSGRFLSR